MASWDPLQSTADMQGRIEAIKVPPSLQNPADVPSYTHQRIESIAIPPILGSNSADLSPTGKHHLPLAVSKAKLGEYYHSGETWEDINASFKQTQGAHDQEALIKAGDLHRGDKQDKSTEPTNK